ncbi:MAG: DUF3137 domain-containing protein [Nocardioides sp.]
MTTDIELESEDFNRAFTVTCSDRKFASDVLHPRMMEFLLAHTEASFRSDRRYVLTVSAGRAFPRGHRRRAGAGRRRARPGPGVRVAPGARSVSAGR